MSVGSEALTCPSQAGSLSWTFPGRGQLAEDPGSLIATVTYTRRVEVGRSGEKVGGGALLPGTDGS